MSQNDNGATPAAPASGTPPAQPAATPPAAQGETVTLTKAEAEQLRKDAARASANQSDADRWRAAQKRGHFRAPAAPVTPPTAEEKAAQAADEDRKAERGLMALALDPSLRTLLDSDPTLRDMLTKNPLAVLPIYAPDAFDAEDAVGLVKNALTERATKIAPAAPATPPPANQPSTPSAPPTGGVNPPSKEVNEEVEKARKEPNTERAVAGMIGAKIRAGKK